MEQVSQGKFSCDACGKVYRWKPELAGRRVKCKCTHVLTAPKEEPGAPEDDDLTAGLYDLAEAEKQSAKRQSSVAEGFRCPSCRNDLPVGALACVSCGFDLRTGAASSAPKLSLNPGRPGGGTAAVPVGGKNPLLAYGAPRRELKQEDAGDNKLVDLYLPMGLIVLGFIGSYLQVTQFSKITYSAADAIPIIGISVIVNLVLTAIGCLAAIKMMDVAFGDPASASLKLCAIVIAPDGIARTISYLVGDTSGFTGWGLSLVMYYCLFSYLFDLDGGETLLLTAIIWTIRTWLGMFVTAILLSTLMSGFSGFGGVGGGVGSGKATLNSDVIAVEALDRGNAKEAKAWLDESVNRIFYDIGRGESVQIVDDLYKLGAKKVTALVHGPEANSLIIELPSDKAKRKAIFAWEASYQTKHRGVATKDEGQDYLILDF